MSFELKPLEQDGGEKTKLLREIAENTVANGQQAQNIESLVNTAQSILTSTESLEGNIGTTTDTPYTGEEDSTARTGISLWKGIKNFLYTIKSAISTVGSAVVSGGFQVTGSDGANARIIKTDSSGNIQARLYDAENNKYAELTPFRELKVVNPVRTVGEIFSGTTLDTNFWTPTTANGGTASLSNGEVLLSTNTTANGSATIQSVRKGIFIPTNAMQFRCIMRLGDTGTENNTRRWGAFNTDSGFFFELNGTTLYAVSRKATVDTKTELSYSLTTNYTRYTIVYTNLSAAFYINDVLYTTLTATSSPLVSDIHLNVRAENVNSNGLDSNIEMGILILSTCRFGEVSSTPTSKYQSGTTSGLVLKYGPGILREVNISAVANNSVITLYDNTVASGTILWSTGSMAAMTQPITVTFSDGLPFFTGLTLVIATASSTVTLLYE